MKAGAESTLLLEEQFEDGDDEFLEALLSSTADRRLKALAAKWYRDRRPWARRMLLRYVDDGCERPRHRALVRALLVLAEDHDDDELMAHFLHAFDGMDRHELKTVRRWRWQTGRVENELVRVSVRPDPRRTLNLDYWKLVKAAPKKAPWRERSPYFSTQTRGYLKRRALRYFRRLARRDAERFVRATLGAMALYDADDVTKPEHIVDVYSLSMLLYRSSGVLRNDSRQLHIEGGRQLSELEPSPIGEEAWRGHSEALLRLLFRSDCLYVRRWIARWLLREEADALAALSAHNLKPLLMSPYGDVQVFAAELIDQVGGFGTFRLEDWLDLLELDNLEVLPKICRLVEEHVAPDRLSFEQLVRLSCLRAAPVAELGLRWLKERPIETAEALASILALADAEADSVRADGVAWLLGHVRGEHGSADQLRTLLDSRYQDVREQAIGLMRDEARFVDEPALWLALSESPYPEMTAFLVAHLEEREPDLPEGRAARVWATTLLSPFRGSRAKRASLRQLSRRVVAEPARADELLPILRVALRSVREAERRSALAAVARAAFEAPALRDAIAKHIPELELFA